LFFENSRELLLYLQKLKHIIKIWIYCSFNKLGLIAISLLGSEESIEYQQSIHLASSYKTNDPQTEILFSSVLFKLILANFHKIKRAFI